MTSTLNWINRQPVGPNLLAGGMVLLVIGMTGKALATPLALDPQAIFNQSLQTQAVSASKTTEVAPTAALSSTALLSNLTPLDEQPGLFQIYQWDLTNQADVPVQIIQGEVVNGLDSRTVRQLDETAMAQSTSLKRKASRWGQSVTGALQVPSLSSWWAERKVASEKTEADQPSVNPQEAWLSLPEPHWAMKPTSRSVVRHLANLRVMPGQKVTVRIAVPDNTEPDIRLLVKELP